MNGRGQPTAKPTSTPTSTPTATATSTSTATATSPNSIPTPTSTSAPTHRLRAIVALRPGDDLGFRLAGVEVRTLAEGEEAAAFRALLADPHLGVLCLDEALLAAAPPHLLARARARGLPILLPFSLPRRWGEAGRGQAWVAALLRRAVGYGVRLGGGPAAAPGGAP